MYRIGLLLITGPFREPSWLNYVCEYLKFAKENGVEILYVKLDPEFNAPFIKSDPVHLKCMSDFVPQIYCRASVVCSAIDVRVLLNCKKRERVVDKISNLDIIITNCGETEEDILQYIGNYFNCRGNVIKLHENMNVRKKLKIGNESALSEASSSNVEVPPFPTFSTVYVGGIYDRLHNGHKVLLSEAVLRATEDIVIGIAEGPLYNKLLWELMQPLHRRMHIMRAFLRDIDDSLTYKFIPSRGSDHPVKTNPDIKCLVVSPETRRPGEEMIVERKSGGMNVPSLFSVKLVGNADRMPGEGPKLSSSTKRLRLMGALIRAPEVSADGYYTILISGNPLTGKTFIANRFKMLGIPVIPCGEIIQNLANSRHFQMIEAFEDYFNDGTLRVNGKLNYKKLVTLCLKNKEKRRFVAATVLGLLHRAIKSKISHLHEQGAKLVIIKDSLLTDGLLGVHINETWSTVLHPAEVCKRLILEYQLSVEEVFDSLSTIFNNEQLIHRSQRVFCIGHNNIWPAQFIDQQILRTWADLIAMCSSG